MAAQLNNEMLGLGNAPNAIRAMFEYGINRAEEIGADNIYNYSIGNPSIVPPKQFDEAIDDLQKNMNAVELHGYSLTPGDKAFRTAIAQNLTKRFGVRADRNNVFITCGCTAALAICIKTITTKPEDEIIAFIPYFPEYRVFVEDMGATFVECDADEEEFIKNIYAEMDSKETEAVVEQKGEEIVAEVKEEPEAEEVVAVETVHAESLVREELKEEPVAEPIVEVKEEPKVEIKKEPKPQPEDNRSLDEILYGKDYKPKKVINVTRYELTHGFEWEKKDNK